jgi:hypothetical protein
MHRFFSVRSMTFTIITLALYVAGSLSSAVHAQVGISRQSFPAMYKIPVKKAHLADVSEFDLKDYSVNASREAMGQADIAYTLPAELLGYEHDLTLYMRDRRTETINGVAEVVREFSSRDADATCRGPWDKMTCEMKFWLKPDLVALEQMLRQARDPRIADRLEVAREFGNDPIGITVTR